MEYMDSLFLAPQFAIHAYLHHRNPLQLQIRVHPPGDDFNWVALFGYVALLLPAFKATIAANDRVLLGAMIDEAYAKWCEEFPEIEPVKIRRRVSQLLLSWVSLFV